MLSLSLVLASILKQINGVTKSRLQVPVEQALVSLFSMVVSSLWEDRMGSRVSISWKSQLPSSFERPRTHTRSFIQIRSNRSTMDSYHIDGNQTIRCSCGCTRWTSLRHWRIRWAISSQYRYSNNCSDQLVSMTIQFHCSRSFLVERYDSKTNKWSPVAAMTTRRKHLGCAVYNGYICRSRSSLSSVSDIGFV